MPHDLQLPTIDIDQGAASEISGLSPEDRQRFDDFLIQDVDPAFPNERGGGVVSPAFENLNVGEENLGVETPAQGVPETFSSPQFETPTDQQGLEVDSTLPLPLTESAVQDVGARNNESIIGASREAASDTGSLKQRRTLNERFTIADHYDYSVQPLKGGSIQATIQPTGVISQGQSVGRAKPLTLQVTDKQRLQIFSQATRYAANFNRMTPMQQGIGGMQLFANAVRPYVTVERDAKGNVISGVPEGAAIANIVDSLSIYNQWGSLNNVERFKETANQIVNLADELGYSDRIPADAVSGLSVLNFGYAAYNLLNNWDNMDVGQRTIGALHVINQGTQAYQAGSALIKGMQGTVAAGSATTTGAQVAAETGAEVGGAQLGSQLATYAGYAAAAYAAYQMVDSWGQGGDAGSRASQASNGAAIGSVFGPVGFVVGAAVGLAIGSINAGKSKGQQKRDTLRNVQIRNNVFRKEEDGRVTTTLEDGSTYDVGVDGSGSTAKLQDGSDKTYANPDRIAERDKKHLLGDNKLRPYDIDYTNDLDYLTSLATKGVNLLPVGGSLARRTSEVDQNNGLLTNAATSNVGREMTDANFSKVMGNVRGFYRNMGITSFEEGIEIVQGMRDERRLSKDDFNAMMIGLDFAFNSDFERAQQLLGQLKRDEKPANVSEEEFNELKRKDLAEIEG